MIGQASQWASTASVLAARFFAALEGVQAIGKGDSGPAVLAALASPHEVAERIMNFFPFPLPPREHLMLFHRQDLLQNLPYEDGSAYSRHVGHNILGHLETVFQDTTLSDEEVISQYFDRFIITLREGAELFLEKLPQVSWRSMADLEVSLYKNQSSSALGRIQSLSTQASTMGHYGLKRRGAALFEELIREVQAMQDNPQERRRSFASMAQDLLSAGLEKTDLCPLLERWLCAKLGIKPEEAKGHIDTLVKAVPSLEAIAGRNEDHLWPTLLLLARESGIS